MLRTFEMRLLPLGLALSAFAAKDELNVYCVLP
jgi:hypothetical protein